MTARIISGKEISAAIRSELKEETARLKVEHGIAPCLATVLVGDDPGSVSYVTGKIRACEELGYQSVHHHLPAAVTEAELLNLVRALNADESVDGVLVQVPLPRHIDEHKVLLAIDPDKDVDGFHPVNVGRLLIGNIIYPPCTPAGIREMIVRAGTPIEGAEVVVVGRSNIVGKPIAMLLVQKGVHANATVTICHTKTRDLAAHTRRADILIVAAGRPKAITADMIRPGATVIDVGVNRIGTTPSGKARLIGDVDFEAAREVAGVITPVPGGVGPMTITMLMKNTLTAARRRLNQR
ncbi:MAG: bifunctional methylenetetrahydrofolate dehydrogenase/methenyltetrahydrofolate cyclohydrolase FolD [Myxococcales bacterium]|nr:bifunctional methylenetetrahydrofolate dehydrogenase/methenyltetrahydrofolate cyclohydrolase FolD [Myxococcales bacterium]